MANEVNDSIEYSNSIKHRLRRIEGQIRGVLRMLEEDKECRDVVTQLTAVRSAVDRAIALLIAGNMEVCIREELEKGNDPDQVVKDAIDLLVKSRS